MLLTISTTHSPATDLSFLLHKHPGKLQTFELSFGYAHVFYSETSPECCSLSLMLDIDPIQLFQSNKGSKNSNFALQQYVNDRPYAASSFLSVAIAQVFGSALSGQCKTKPDLVERPIPLKATISVISSQDGEELISRLFVPLGYEVKVSQYPLDEHFPDWGISNYFTLQIQATTTLKLLLSHLYILIPVLDNDKHYFVGEDEINKLTSHGEGWLSTHPEKDLIVERYLRHRRNLTESALALLREEDSTDKDKAEDHGDLKEETVEKSIGLNQQRVDSVYSEIKAIGGTRFIDLGCGEGKLIKKVLPEPQFMEIAGMDVSIRNLSKADSYLQIDRLPEIQRKKLKLFQGSLLYKDKRLQGYDVATLIEVIEHLDPIRLELMEKVVFGNASPGSVIVTTPNREYNRNWANLADGKFRHPDHHFEWTRDEFQTWAKRVASQYLYLVNFKSIGPEDSEIGSPTQMAIFKREGNH